MDISISTDAISVLSRKDNQNVDNVIELLDNRLKNVTNSKDMSVILSYLYSIYATFEDNEEVVSRIKNIVNSKKVAGNGIYLNAFNQFNSTLNSFYNDLISNDMRDIQQVSYDNNLVFINESRYSRDFKTISILGKGGFGEVTKVQNILDQGIYAIKRITFLPHQNIKNIEYFVREVRTLACLSHPNVVRYYSCWIESGNLSEITSKKKINILSDSQSYFYTEDGSDDDNRVEELSNNYYSDSPSPYDHSNLTYGDSESLYETSINNVGNEVLISEDDSNKLIIRNDSLKNSLVLCIQMECCDGFTLQQYLSSPQRIFNSIMINSIMYQLSLGLMHIHSKGIIHRDIKPGNIFLLPDNTVKIGDFGLAVKDAMIDTSVENMDLYSLHSTGIGTAVYAAPEQISSDGVYGCEVDIYSLGIIFFEINSKYFCTDMERSKAINDLISNRKLTLELTDSPYEELILDMTNIDPSIRPHSDTLVQTLKHM